MAGSKPAATDGVEEQPAAAPDYRPSVRLAPEDEIRLLDAALQEARARPRPPAVALPALAPQPAAPRLSNGAALDGQLAHMNGHANGVSVEAMGEGEDGGDDILVDRKRLLAAIICILQDELTKSTPADGGTRRGPGKRSTRRATRVRSTVIRETEGGPSPRR